MLSVGINLIFQALSETGKLSVWVSDGTLIGTRQVGEFATTIRNDSATDNNVARLHGEYIFTVTGSTLAGLWRSDGTPDGTILIKSFGHTDPFAATAISNLTNSNGVLYFAPSRPNGADSFELWKSDGVPQGTLLVKDINPGLPGSSVSGFTFLNDATYFWANDGSNGTELWKTNGTSAGTALVRDINPGPGSSPPFLAGVARPSIVAWNQSLAFDANNIVNGRELWISDGTSSGTSLIDVGIQALGGRPSYLADINGIVYFAATESQVSKAIHLLGFGERKFGAVPEGL